MRGRAPPVAALAAAIAVVAIAGLPAAAIAGDDATSRSLGEAAHGVAPTIDADDYDERLDSGTTFWAGQRLYFDGSDVVADVGNASTGERTFQLRRVDDGGDVGRLVREFVVDADGEAVVRTGALEGEFVVRYDGEPVYVQDGTGYADSPPDGAAVTVEGSAWEVAVQTLSASWSDDRVGRNEIVALHLESNRALYLVAVSAEGLTYRDLESIFDPHFYANDQDVRADDDVIVLRGGSDVDVSAYFAGIDDGSYVLSIEVVDADARTTAEVRVGRPRTTATTQPTTATTTPSPDPTPPTTARAGTDASGPPTTSSPAAATTTPAPATTTAPGQPGFDATAGVIAMLSAALIWGKRLR